MGSFAEQKAAKERKILDKLLSNWTIVNPDCVIIEQDEAPDNYQELVGGKENISYDKKGKPIKFVMTTALQKEEQIAIGTGVVIKKSDDCDNPDRDFRLKYIEVGDKIRFSAGTQINAEFKHFQRIQILHVANILMVQKLS